MSLPLKNQSTYKIEKLKKLCKCKKIYILNLIQVTFTFQQKQYLTHVNIQKYRSVPLITFTI